MAKVNVTYNAPIMEQVINCGGEDTDPIYGKKIYIADFEVFSAHYKGANSPKLKISYEISSLINPTEDAGDWATGDILEDEFTGTANWGASAIVPVLALWVRLKIERLSGNDANAQLTTRVIVASKMALVK
jgi:hypothetical protein